MTGTFVTKRYPLNYLGTSNIRSLDWQQRHSIHEDTSATGIITVTGLDLDLCTGSHVYESKGSPGTERQTLLRIRIKLSERAKARRDNGGNRIS